MKKLFALFLITMMFIAMPMIAEAVSPVQVAQQELAMWKGMRTADETALQFEIVNADKRNEFCFLTNFGTGDQILYPGVADYIYSVTKDTSDSSLNLAVTGYSFANDTSDVDYMIFGDATVSWPDTVVSYTDKYINSTLYWIGCTESSGNLKFIFYNSSYAKVAVPGIYQLSIGIAFFDNP